MTEARTLAGEALATALRESRRRTRSWTFDLDDAQWRFPRQPGVNLIAWELAHLAWFAEFWVLRGPHTLGSDGRVEAQGPARFAGPDALFDSARLAHLDRWKVSLPSRAELDDRLDMQLQACLLALARTGDSDESLYFHRLVLLHEDMHGEAFAWLRATLGYGAPEGLTPPRAAAAPAPGISLPGTEFRQGWPAAQRGFAFDNERAEHPVRLPAFEIDAAPVTMGQYLRFVEAGGYDDVAWWPGEAGRWRAAHSRSHPARWRRRREWETRWFGEWRALDPDHILLHVSAWEAEAYARWAGRRLPTAAEWEHAALSQPAFDWGRSAWEWTASSFEPYPGFLPGPYGDYSAPWFGDHRELRGGAFATHARLHDARYRNFFVPERTDVFAGFRTAAP